MKQSTLFDICEGNHGGNVNSKQARQRTNAAADRRRILAAIQAAGHEGKTCDELEAQLGLSHQSCSARCSELKRSGAVRERGYRLTRTGSKAGVLVAQTRSRAVDAWKQS